MRIGAAPPPPPPRPPDAEASREPDSTGSPSDGAPGEPPDGASSGDKPDDAYRPLVLPPPLQHRHDEVTALLAAEFERTAVERDGAATSLDAGGPETHEGRAGPTHDSGASPGVESRIIEITIITDPPDPLDVTGNTEEDNNGDDNPVGGGNDDADEPFSPNNTHAMQVFAGQVSVARQIAVVAASPALNRGNCSASVSDRAF